MIEDKLLMKFVKGYVENNKVKVRSKNIEDEIQKEEENKEQNNNNNEIDTSKLMVDSARKIMGDFLISYFNGWLPGQKKESRKYHRNTINWRYNSIIKEYGLDLLTILPYKHSKLFTSKRILQNYFNNNLDGNIIKNILNELDIKGNLNFMWNNEKKEKKISELIKLIPKLKGMLEDLNYLGIMNILEARTTLHPQLIVMGMEQKYRPLAVIAVNKAFNNYRVKVLNKKLSKKDKTCYLDYYLSEMTPPDEYYIKTAKEFKINDADMIATMANFLGVLQKYRDTWK